MKSQHETDGTRRHYVANIKAVCLGNSAIATLNRMTGPELEGVEPILVDAARPQERRVEIGEALKGADMVVLIAGEGGEAEVEAAPVIGEIAKNTGALVAGVITCPLAPEDYSARVEEGVQSLREAVDMLIMVPDDTLLPGFFAALRGG